MPDKEGNIPLNWAQKSKSIDVQKYLETLSDHKKTLTQDFDENTHGKHFNSAISYKQTLY